MLEGNLEVSDLDREISEIQRSTRTLIPRFVPLHDELRHRFRWYYLWHLSPRVKLIHYAALVYAALMMSVLAAHLFVQVESVQAATKTWDTQTDWSAWTRTNLSSSHIVGSLTLTPTISDTSTNATFQGSPQWKTRTNGANSSHALQFSSSSMDYLSIQNSNANWNPGTGAFTIEAWIKTNADTTDGNNGMVISKRKYDSDSDVYINIENGKAGFCHITAGHNECARGTTTVNDNLWHHLAGVIDSKGSLKIFVDGLSEKILNHSADLSSDQVWQIAGMRDSGLGDPANVSERFTGLIDDVRISNAEVYTGNFTPAFELAVSSSTLGLWHFNESTGASTQNGKGITYSTSGSATITFKPEVGRNQTWSSRTLQLVNNSYTATEEYSLDGQSYGSFSSKAQGKTSETLYLKLTASTSNTSSSPEVQSLTVNYTDAGAAQTGASPPAGATGGTAPPGTSPTSPTSGSPTSPPGSATSPSGKPAPGTAPFSGSTQSTQPAPSGEPGTIPQTPKMSAQQKVANLLESQEPIVEISKQLAVPSVPVVTTAAAVPGLLSAIASYLAAASSGLPIQFGVLLRALQLFSFSGLTRRRRPAWGEVVDRTTGVAIAGVLVQLTNVAQAQIVDRTITDQLGRFVILVSRPGIYRLEVKAKGFKPYQSQSIQINDLAVLPKAMRIVLDSDSQPSQEAILKLARRLEQLARGLRTLRLPILVVGMLASLVVLGAEITAGEVTVITWGVALIYLTLLITDIWHYVYYQKPYGRVLDQTTGKPLELAIVRVLRMEQGGKQLASTTVTDHLGRFSVLVESGVYQLDVTKAGYQPHQTPPERWSGEFTLVNKAIMLQRGAPPAPASLGRILPSQ